MRAKPSSRSGAQGLPIGARSIAPARTLPVRQKTVGLDGLKIGGANLGREPVEQIFVWLYLAGLAWVPFWYGSNDWVAWGINAMIFPGLTAGYELSLLVRGKSHPVALNDLAIPAVLFGAVVVWAGLQTINWSGSWPANPIWAMAANALNHSIGGSISVNRDLTVLALMRLITAGSVFWLAIQLCRESKRARLLIFGIGTIGAIYCLYGLIAVKFGGLALLSYVDTRRISSTFIDPDSFATYAAITLIVLVGLILEFYGEGMRAAAGNWRMQIAFFIDRTGGRGAALLAAAFVVFTSLLLTGSRGALMAALVGLFLLAAQIRQRDRARAPLVLLAIGSLLVTATLLEFGDVVRVKLEEGGIYDAGRVAVYTLTLRSIMNAPLLGYGYGTFADVFPMYRDRSIGVLGVWGQAHNTYLEVFQGLGLIFGSMLVGCVALLVLRCVKGSLTRRRDIMIPAVGASVAAVVTAHAMVDFSLQIQGIAATFIAILGVGVAQSKPTHADPKG